MLTTNYDELPDTAKLTRSKGRRRLQRLRKSDRVLIVVLFTLSLVFLIPSFAIIQLEPSLVFGGGLQQFLPILGLVFLILFFLFLIRPPKKSEDDEEAASITQDSPILERRSEESLN